MKYVIISTVICLAAAPSRAEPDAAAKAREILTQANAAAARLTAIQYDARVHVEGGIASQFPPLQGTVRAARGSSNSQHRVRIDGAAAKSASEKMTLFKFAIDGERVYHADVETKVFTSGSLAEAGGAAAHSLFIPKFLHASPFAGELRNSSVRYEGVQPLDGVACDVIALRNLNPQSPESRLFLGKEDHLLRQIEIKVRHRAPPGKPAMGGRIIFTVSNLNAQPAIDEGIFRLECPEGFEKRTFAPSQAEPLKVGSKAPDWSLKTPDGRTVTLQSLRGKVVLLSFWGTWCGYCKMSMPALQKIHERFKGKPVAVYGINCQERSADADPVGYMKQKGYTYGQLVDGDAVANAYHVNGLPIFYMIGRDGSILHSLPGFVPQLEQLMTQAIEDALRKRP